MTYCHCSAGSQDFLMLSIASRVLPPGFPEAHVICITRDWTRSSPSRKAAGSHWKGSVGLFLECLWQLRSPLSLHTEITLIHFGGWVFLKVVTFLDEAGSQGQDFWALFLTLPWTCNVVEGRLCHLSPYIHLLICKTQRTTCWWGMKGSKFISHLRCLAESC